MFELEVHRQNYPMQLGQALESESKIPSCVSSFQRENFPWGAFVHDTSQCMPRPMVPSRACLQKKKRSFFFSIHVEFKSCFAFVQNALRCEIPCLPTKHKRHFTVVQQTVSDISGFKLFGNSCCNGVWLRWVLQRRPQRSWSRQSSPRRRQARVVSSWKRFNTKALEVPQIGVDLFKPLKPRGLGLHRFSHD